MRLLAFGFAALAVACGGPTVGDLTSQEVTLTVRAVSSSPDVAAVGDAQGGLGVTRAFLSASAVSLLPCNDEIAPLVLEPRGYELVYQPPFRERITTAVNDFCGLRVDVDPLEQNATEGVPDGASLYVEGTDANGDAFTLSSESSFSLLLETEEPGFGKVPLLLGLDVALWLQGLPLPEDMSGMATEMFDDQLHDATRLYVDENEDGALDDAESTPILRAD